MNREEILSHVDHTLLKPEATWPQIQTLCDEAIANHTASVCINTCYVKQAVEYMAGRIPVCCVVGFPLGAMDTASKAFEAKTAIENGAAEVDMVINIGRLKNKEYDAVREDIAAVKRAVGDKVLKVIIETCLLTDEEKEKMCDIVVEAGADFLQAGHAAMDADFALRGRGDAGNQLEQRALSRAVAADETVDLSLFKGEGRAPQHLLGPEALLQLVDNQLHGRQSTTPVRSRGLPSRHRRSRP